MSEQVQQERKLKPFEPVEIGPFERVTLGGDEPAICASIGLAPDSSGSDPTSRVLIMDVGFRTAGPSTYGPYDLDGSGKKQFFNSSYVLVSSTQNDDGSRSMRVVEAPIGKDIAIGRNTPTGIDLGIQSGNVSRNHCTVRIGVNGSLMLTDTNSLNGTVNEDLHKLLQIGDNEKTEYGYTVNIADYVSNAGRGHVYEPKHENEGWGFGVYAGRPIIARDTPINGGVYPVGGKRGEALVIDDKKYPKEFDQIYAMLINSLTNIESIALHGVREAVSESSATNRAHPLLDTVFNIVSNTLRYDKAATDALARDYQKINLNYYIAEGVGVCRTQAALGAYFIERLIKDGHLAGRVSIDRNTSETYDGVSGGHAWTRYTDEHGMVYIIDPAQQFVGTLKESRKHSYRWDYRRTEDLVRELIEV